MANTKIPVELSSTPGIVDNSNATAITIDSSENVGIGTTATDSYSLGSTGKTLSINSSNAGTGSLISMESADAKRGYLFANESNIVLSAVHTDIPLIFNTNDTERMRIDGGGRVMIAETSNSGYSANADDLIVGNNGSATERGISIGATSGGSIRWNDGADAGIIEYAHSSNSMRLYTAGNEKMRIDSSGKVGIGVSSPVSQLHIEDSSTVHVVGTNTGADGNTGTTCMELIGQARGYNNDISRIASIEFRTDPSLWYRGNIIFNVANNDGTNKTLNPLEAMRIESFGMVKLAPSINIGSLRNNGVSVGTSATNVLDMGSLVTSGDVAKGRYLITVCAASGTVGTAATGIFGLSSSGAIYLYETLNSDSVTLGTSGGNVTAQTSGTTYTMHVNAIPLSVDN